MDSQTRPLNKQSNHWFEPLQIQQQDVLLFVYLCCASLMAKGLSIFNFAYSQDDYRVFVHELVGFSEIEAHLYNGRWAAALIEKGLLYLGLELPTASSLFGIPVLILSVFLAIHLANHWKVQGTLSRFIFCGILCCHPFLAELSTFRVAALMHVLTLLLTVLALPKLWKDDLKSRIACIAMLTASYSFYQVNANIVIAIILVDFIVRISESNKLSDNAIYQNLKPSFNATLVLIASLGFYFCITKFTMLFMDSDLVQRGRLIGFDEFFPRMMDALKYYKSLFFGHHHLQPTATRVLFLAIVFTGLVSTYVSIWSSKNSQRQKIMFSALVSIAFVGLILSIRGVILVIGDFTPHPRTLASISVVTGGFFLLATRKNSIIKTPVLICATAMLVSFVAIYNQVFLDQLRINQRDHHAANRIWARLEQHDRFSEMRSFVIFGGDKLLGIVDTTSYSLNMPAFSPGQSREAILREVIGANFPVPSVEESAMAREYAKQQMRPWPDKNSVAIVEGVGIVLLPSYYPL